MASTDATGIPIKNQAYRVTFPILDADGDPVTAAGSLDSEISKDGGTFTDCTNEATEIATSSGMYFLDLTSTEMNADTVAIIVKSTGGKTTPIVLYPAEAADIKANVVSWLGSAPNALVSSRVDASVGAIAANAITATAINADAITAAKVADGTIDANTFAASAINAAAIASDAITAAKIAADAITAAKIADAAIDSASLATDMDGYTGKLSVIDDDTGTTDRWVMAWYKNGVPLTAGITSPTIQVVKISDGTDLVASSAMTQVGSTPFFKKDEATNRIVNGAAYGAICTATIGGASRTWPQIIGRPS